MQQNRVKAKNELRWFLNFMNLNLEKLSDKDLFVLWMDIRERVYGERGPLFISDQSLLEWGKRRDRTEGNSKVALVVFSSVSFTQSRFLQFLKNP